MSDTLRQDIIFKILKIASDNSDLGSDEQFNLADSGTKTMFAQLMSEGASSSVGEDPDQKKSQNKAADEKER